MIFPVFYECRVRYNEIGSLSLKCIGLPLSEVIKKINANSKVEYRLDSELSDKKIVIICNKKSKIEIINSICILLGCNIFKISENSYSIVRKKEVEGWIDKYNRNRSDAHESVIQIKLDANMKLVDEYLNDKNPKIDPLRQKFLESINKDKIREIFNRAERELPDEGNEVRFTVPRKDMLTFSFSDFSAEQQNLISQMASGMKDDRIKSSFKDLSQMKVSLFSDSGIGLSFDFSNSISDSKTAHWGGQFYGDGPFTTDYAKRQEDLKFDSLSTMNYPPKSAFLGVGFNKYPNPTQRERFVFSETNTKFSFSKLKQSEVLEKIGETSMVVSDYFTFPQRFSGVGLKVDGFLGAYSSQFNSAVSFKNNLFMSRRLNFPDLDKMETTFPVAENLIRDKENKKEFLITDLIEILKEPDFKLRNFADYKDDYKNINMKMLIDYMRDRKERDIILSLDGLTPEQWKHTQTKGLPLVDFSKAFQKFVKLQLGPKFLSSAQEIEIVGEVLDVEKVKEISDKPMIVLKARGIRSKKDLGVLRVFPARFPDEARMP